MEMKKIDVRYRGGTARLKVWTLGQTDR